jgi:hypothetical protein
MGRGRQFTYIPTILMPPFTGASGGGGWVPVASCITKDAEAILLLPAVAAALSCAEPMPH